MQGTPTQDGGGLQFLRDRVVWSWTQGHLQDHLPGRQDAEVQLRLSQEFWTDVHGLQGELYLRIGGIPAWNPRTIEEQSPPDRLYHSQEDGYTPPAPY
ncbi:protein of unknown function [Nitrospira japonica]|uniref:Uncharacterized protein n=1 Tax=Nitrospira japonica TaxID=1325564 RepID=A0A1W1I784_9BACT|nr:protein of unknown function [Nitrospira japonica]